MSRRKDSFFDDDDPYQRSSNKDRKENDTQEEEIKPPSLSDFSDYSDDFERMDNDSSEEDHSKTKELKTKDNESKEQHNNPPLGSRDREVKTQRRSPSVYSDEESVYSSFTEDSHPQRLPSVSRNKKSHLESHHHGTPKGTTNSRRSKTKSHEALRLPPIDSKTRHNGVSSAPKALAVNSVRKKDLPIWRKPPVVNQPKRSHPFLDSRRSFAPSKANIIRARCQGPTFNF